MFVNPNRQTERLKAENQRLKESIAALETQNSKLKRELADAEQIAQSEITRAQKILLDCESIEKQWKQSIETARLAKIRYDDLYKKCCKLKRKQK